MKISMFELLSDNLKYLTKINKSKEYKCGYEDGWKEAIKQKNILDNLFVLDEQQSLIELLKGKTVIDEFYINYRFNSKNNNIICKENNNNLSEYAINLETFLDYKDVKFKIYSEENKKGICGYSIYNVKKDKIKTKFLLMPFIHNSLDFIIEHQINENKDYKFTIICEEI